MKTVTFCGVQNSGKTTLIREVIHRLRKRGRNSAVIVNERGEADFDAGFVQTNGIHVEYLRGG